MKDEYNIETCIANEPTYISHGYVSKHADYNNTKYAKNIGERIISLPIHFKMKSSDNRYIVNSLIKTIEQIKKYDTTNVWDDKNTINN